MHRKKLKELIDNGISNSPLMLHGTGLASLLKLNETGVLPVGRLPEKQTQNYLYFAPIQKRFTKTKFYRELYGCNLNWALQATEEYAKIHMQDEYISKRLISAGFSKEYAELLALEVSYGINMQVPNSERKRAFNLGKSWWAETHRQAHKVKSGAIIEADESILELKLSLDPDREGLRIFCPDGLDIKYIKGIKILDSA